MNTVEVTYSRGCCPQSSMRSIVMQDPVPLTEVEGVPTNIIKK